jgi:hypothetical protein
VPIADHDATIRYDEVKEIYEHLVPIFTSINAAEDFLVVSRPSWAANLSVIHLSFANPDTDRFRP